MTKISQYSTDVNITGNDKWIGSDAQNFLITKNFTPNNLANYFNENNVIDIGASIRYRYQTLLPGEAREQGTISFETEIGPQVNFSAITTFLIAKNTLKGNTVTQYLDFLVDGKVLLSKASNINIFGYYKITSIEPWIPNTNFFVVEVDFLTGNGFISEDLDYLVSLVDKVQDIPPPVWGSITGDIEDQTDLINYISSQIAIPTWQETLDVDFGVSNIVTTPFYYDDGIIRNSFDGTNIRIEQLTGDLLSTTLTPGQLGVSNSTSGKSLYIDYDFGIQFYKVISSSAKSTYIKADNVINNNVIFQLPNKITGTYILATLDDIPSLTGYVPYTGATTDLNLGTYNLTADHIALNINPSGAGFVVGATQWNNTIGLSQTLLKGGTVALKNGVDLVARVVNKVVPNTTLTKAAYQVVRISGAQGQRLAVDLAQGDTDLNSADTLGVVTETIATNQEGFIMTVGQLEDINTTGSLQGETWTDGDVLYLSPTIAGRMTNIKPTGATGHIVVLGYVEYAHANNGKIYVKIMNGWELDELHNVFIDNPLNNQVLSYNSAVQLWENKDLDQIVSERRNANNSTNNSINYCGTAPNGSAESTAVWTIIRLTITAGGSVTTATATNVAWTNRESAIYI